MPTLQTSLQHRILPLDGLRAFSILLVMLSHTLTRVSPSSDVQTFNALQNMIYNGWCGVDMFFVLSGFLITSQLIHQKHKNMKSYVLRRFMRIAPAYYISVTLALILSKIPSKMPPLDYIGSLFYWLPTYLSCLFFVQDYTGTEDKNFPSIFWTIPIEMKFYLLAPLLVFLLMKTRDNTGRILILSSAFLAYILLKNLYFLSTTHTNDMDYVQYFWNIKARFHFSLEGLMMGALCAFILERKSIKNLTINSKASNIAAFTGLLIFFALTMITPHYFYNVRFFEKALMPAGFSLAFGLLLLGAVKGCIFSTFLSHKILRFIAMISYSLYLTHIYFLDLHHYLVEKILTVIPSMALAWMLALPVFFIFVGGLSYLLYTYVEKPCIEWSKSKAKSFV